MTEPCATTAPRPSSVLPAGIRARSVANDNGLRAYFHCKSADWPGNQPFSLQGWSASELARVPTC